MPNIIEYKGSHPDIVFLMVDYTSKITDSWTKELVKNLSDFVLCNILQKGYTVLQGIEEDALLQSAGSYQHAVVFSTGTEFINGSNFFTSMEKAVERDYFLQGHIPDRREGYYQLHEQCYFINLDVYRNLGCPKIGEFSFYDEHTQIKPLRSKENIHDDYTPVWIKPGNHIETYQHKWHGWNILSIAFKNNLPVLVFDENIRNNKQYYYPEYQKAFDVAQEYLYGKYIVSSQPMFYPINTETGFEINLDVVHQLITQASGLNWIDTLIDIGFDNLTTVTFVDNNFFALECMEKIVSWNGTDYAGMINEVVNSKTDFLNYTMSRPLTESLKDIDDGWNNFLEKYPNWQDLWQKIKQNVKFNFVHADLVLNRSLPVGTWLQNVPNTVVNLSHIFNYDPSAPFTPLKQRVENENNLICKIAKVCPDALIVFNKRAAESFTDNFETKYISYAKNMKITDFSQINRPTWRLGDW